ncbi:GH92 family glycosyl hydrolase [Parabacteroides pacaensis]|uniref:GH92 family glycosyl hydrolase n=1 Tax=Parabacteroides pacaensis TaxID=2086575 RepID=UPI000D0EBA89|nr:GH92 family glycosyl hydrolase [Parabacteroides pacaensis]
MSNLKIIYSLLFILSCITCARQEVPPVEDVNALIGTHSNRSFSHGNTYPAVTRPWGMNFWTPQTGIMSDNWIYTYHSDSIRGFRQTHLPSPWIGDYGTFSIMPVSGQLKVYDTQRAAAFSHALEKATPYYYSVQLQDEEILAEMTATERCGLLRFSFNRDEDRFVVLDAFHQGASVTIVPEENKIVGFCKNHTAGVPDNFANYFVIHFDCAFEAYGTWDAGAIYTGKKELAGKYVGAYLCFSRAVKTVNLKISSSFISTEQAIRNLQTEIGNKNFEEVKDETYAIWNNHLKKVEIEGGTEEQRKTFYSNFYRASLFPCKFYEYDSSGEPVHYSPYDGKVHKGYMYTDNGVWDTFRSLHPWLSLMFPLVSREIIESLVNTYKEGGWFPSWTSPGYRNSMIGSHAVSLIADALQKGITGFDLGKAYEAALKDCYEAAPAKYMGRYGYDEYNKKGYLPYPEYEQATAMSLEYAYDDYCIMQLARFMNRKEDINLFAARAKNYIHSYDASTGFMRPRKADGNWYEHFNGYLWGGPFTEGNAWQYTWSVFHDVEGLIKLMGGNEAFTARLDSVFIAPLNSPLYGRSFNEIAEMHAAGMGQYAHGNQPAQHILYLYNYAGQPWKTQHWVRKALDRLYNSTPSGYCGDEDNGQTSSWYLFSALGFYPVCPGSGQYVLGSPLFRSAKLTLENGKTFVIKAPRNSASNVYVKSKELNGKKYNPLFINHKDIANGGKLQFEMSPHPSKEIKYSQEERPYSLLNDVN